MAKQKLELNKKEFQAIVDKLEKDNTFESPSHLWIAVENTDWAKKQKPRPLTAAVAYQRYKAMGIVIKTKAGKRGRKAGQGMPAGSRKTKGGRAEKMKFYEPSFDGMRISLPLVMEKRFAGTVEKAKKGSLKAAITLKCLDCTCYQPVEVKKCTVNDCALYPHRPWKMEEEKTRLKEFLAEDGEPWKGYYEEIGDEEVMDDEGEEYIPEELNDAPDEEDDDTADEAA